MGVVYLLALVTAVYHIDRVNCDVGQIPLVLPELNDWGIICLPNFHSPTGISRK